MTIIQGGEFGYQESIEFVADDFVSIPETISTANVKIYPNPFAYSTNVNFTLTQSEEVYIEIFNLLGQKVFETGKQIYEAGMHDMLINPENPDNGIYFVQMHIGDQKFTRKISVKR
ncbi:MAG: T9SS type A sorting domain-containing protein [Bacteroidota bacterium]|nr:T9SS type A sorting domain-containing protein [Bacteroidota bacterium]